MEKIVDTIQELGTHVKEYVETTVSLFKIRAAEKASNIIADAAAIVIASLLLIFFLLFMSFGCGYLLSNIIGNNYAGFLIIGGIYLLFAIILWIGRKKIIRNRLLNAIVRRLFENNHQNENN